MLTSISKIVFAISIAVILLFALVYFILFRLLYINKKKVVENGLDDATIQKDVNYDYQKYLQKKNKEPTFIAECKKQERRGKIVTRIGDVFASIIYLFLLVLLSFSIYVRMNNEQVFINNTTYFVVQTSSMETVNPSNTYIEENNLTNQIPRFSFVGVEKTDDIKLYDIVAFKMDDQVIIHRVVDITSDERYTMRGDANIGSMLKETNVAKEDIIGVYNGTQSELFGHVIVFLQNGIGMISVLASVALLLIYAIYSDRIIKKSNERYLLLASALPAPATIENKVDESKSKVIINTPVTIAINDHFDRLIFIDNPKSENEASNEEMKAIVINDNSHNPIIESTYTKDNIWLIPIYVDENTKTTEEIPEVIEETVAEEDEEEDISVIESFRTGTHYTLFSKLSLAEDDVRNNYQKIKNHILSYKKVKCRSNKNNETFNIGRNMLMRITVIGKSVKINFALNPIEMEPRYHTVDNSEVKTLQKYPVGLKVRSKRSVKYAFELIDKTLQSYQLKYDENHNEDYLASFPKMSKEELIEKGYIIIRTGKQK